MPEGNEVHRWAERHTAAFAGRKLRVAPGPNLRFTEADKVDGKTLRAVHAVGKHLGYEFGDDLLLHVHLGRFGDWTEGCGPLAEPKGQLRMVMQRTGRGKGQRSVKGQPHNLTCAKDDGTQPFPPEDVDWVELRGPTDCSVYDRENWAKLLARLGPDPLGEDGNGHDDPEHAYAAILARKNNIAELLMDQTVLSGVGNIYRAEILFRHRVNPFTPGAEMDKKVLRAMWKDLGPLLRAGMVDRRIVCTKRKDRPSGKEPAERGEEHYVYRRHGKPCFVCGTRVLHRDLAGRTLYWCPECQKTTETENRTAFAHGLSLRASRAAAKRRKELTR
jgi:endonuclease VIII